MKTSAIVAATVSVLAVTSYFAYRALLQEPETDSTHVETSPDAEATSAIEQAATLPDFSLATLSGERRSIHDWPGQALVINFWATWCPPCIREIPLLKDFQDTHADNNITVVGVAVDRLEPVRAFATDMAFNYPVLVGQSEAMEAAAAFGIEFFALPFTVFTDGDANVLGVHTGELHTEDLENVATVIMELDAGGIDLDEARARIDGRI